MGRRPNPLILEYFQRGPKLTDNSNRYPHTCKLCGEDFPKGRIDSLTNHITKSGKCPAISETDRINACLTLHGIPNVPSVTERLPANVTTSTTADVASATDTILAQQWSALEALAEASRQVDMSEKHDRPGAGMVPVQLGTTDGTGIGNIGAAGLQGTERFELQEQFTLENPPAGYDTTDAAMTQQNLSSLLSTDFQTTTAHTADSPSHSLVALKADSGTDTVADAAPKPPSPTTEALTSKDPQHALVLPTPSVTSMDTGSAMAHLSVAEAATARLTSSLLDPQLVAEQTASALHSVHDPQSVQATPGPHNLQVGEPAPWGEMTYLTNKPQPAVARDIRTPVPAHRGGVRMDTADLSPNGRPKHARARFSAARRKEVQEVRKLGACIRCRILRKTCGKGDPCDTCCKVLSPRVWRAGCVRTRLHEQLELYSAGVQVVLAQNRYNMIKNSMQLNTGDSYIEGTLFPAADSKIMLRTFEINTHKEPTAPDQEPEMETRAIMIDCDSEDMPAKVEEYMRQVLPLLIEHEPSAMVRVILDTAVAALAETDVEDDLLRHALELWGLVDIIDRERQWHILEKRTTESTARLIRDPNERLGIDIYTVMLIQLNAAAERKANTTSRTLLNKMQRFLQDSKVKIGFRMFLTALVFLNCIEKSTWAFRAWEQQNLRGGWPLERQPETFIGQGANLASLLKLLLNCRRVLPVVSRNEETGALYTNEAAGAEFAAFYRNLNVTYETLHNRQEKAEFNPVDSRCLELTLCAQLLLGS
ncbi:hypothetical protein TD95_001480 [Thielaviopsis punctulata]|uniref:Uncharacterized protein n=1 Tax=Thielaviopsis punctulata TaxID=72032 RepID=A0A0F4ZJ63_9PEZI|nr:hypothetical protein TD95_001480 [Thielaviopsis punctulata]